MIEHLPFYMDKNQRERIPSLGKDYGCICQYSHHHSVGWHWHEAMEINYVEKGSGTFSAGGSEVEIRKGDTIFVNSNRMHSGNYNRGEEVGIYTLKILPEFLYGAEGSLFEQKYVLPLTGCRSLPLYRIRPETEAHVYMTEHVVHLLRLFREEPEDYEILVHTQLWELWRLLLRETEDLRKHGARTASAEPEMIRQMLEFIHEHYSERITVDDIAEAGALSRRECSRRFRRYIHTSPNDYLNYYRLHEASGRLLQSEDSIAAVSEDCGFSSVSYFAQKFREEFGCTPREFRKSNPILSLR